MSRVDRLFAKLRGEERCGLIAYVTCGDPDRETTVEIVRALELAGADAIELGVPFSDPIADGPVIQAAAQRALAGGTTIEDLFAIARDVRRESQVPLIAFSYVNPILRYGVERFAEAANASGIDSLLVTDLPPEAAGELRTAMRSRGIGVVFLLAPTSPQARVERVDRATDGFVYYVSTTGVTGARRALDPELIERLRDLRRVVKHPVAVGFGISTNEHFRELAPHCDAIVVGSAIVRAIAEGEREGAAARAEAVVGEILGRARTAKGELRMKNEE
jgi:tryptophan synthase alpha chain